MESTIWEAKSMRERNENSRYRQKRGDMHALRQHNGGKSLTQIPADHNKDK